MFKLNIAPCLRASVAAILLLPASLLAHDPITSKVTWNQEIIRIFRQRCVTCHRDGGGAFALESYEQARAWSRAIRDEVLGRTMPPWPAAQGFGNFRDDP